METLRLRRAWPVILVCLLIGSPESNAEGVSDITLRQFLIEMIGHFAKAETSNCATRFPDMAGLSEEAKKLAVSRFTLALDSLFKTDRFKGLEQKLMPQAYVSDRYKQLQLDASRVTAAAPTERDCSITLANAKNESDKNVKELARTMLDAVIADLKKWK